MPQLDTVTYMSQFFWLCIFFLGFYFSLVQYILPKMSRIIKYRQEKIKKIQKEFGSYISETQSEQDKRWASYLACLEIQKELAQAETIRKKEVVEESWENALSLKTQAAKSFTEAYLYLSKESKDLNFTGIAFIILIKKKAKTLMSKTLTSKKYVFSL